MEEQALAPDLQEGLGTLRVPAEWLEQILHARVRTALKTPPKHGDDFVKEVLESRDPDKNLALFVYGIPSRPQERELHFHYLLADAVRSQVVRGQLVMDQSSRTIPQVWLECENFLARDPMGLERELITTQIPILSEELPPEFLNNLDDALKQRLGPEWRNRVFAVKPRGSHFSAEPLLASPENREVFLDRVRISPALQDLLRRQAWGKRGGVGARSRPGVMPYGFPLIVNGQMRRVLNAKRLFPAGERDRYLKLFEQGRLPGNSALVVAYDGDQPLAFFDLGRLLIRPGTSFRGREDLLGEVFLKGAELSLELDRRMKESARWPPYSAPQAAGLEESAADRAALAELEAIVRNPGVPRRVPIVVEKVTPGGAKVRYERKQGGVAQGFLPVGMVFADPQQFVRRDAKLTWLEMRKRKGDLLEVFPEEIREGEVIFRLDQDVRGELFDEEPVFYDQVVASFYPGQIQRFLQWLALDEQRDSSEKIIQMYYDKTWSRLRQNQSFEMIRWLAGHVHPQHAMAALPLFKDVVETPLQNQDGRQEWADAQEEALRGIRRIARHGANTKKAELLEVIQGFWGLIEERWTGESLEEGHRYLREAASALDTEQAAAWLKQVSTAGLEEVKRFESVEKFLQAYREDLSSSGLLRRVEIFATERILATEVLVIPSQPVVRQMIRVYVLAAEQQEQSTWEAALQERLSREGDRLQGVSFLVERYPADGRLKTDLPTIIVQQTGAVIPWEHGIPIVKLSVLPELKELNPSLIYSLAVNKTLAGMRIGPVLEVVPVWDGSAIFV